MARTSHYSSSALADATSGRRLPSRALVEAFAAACGADPADWVTRWKQAGLPPAPAATAPPQAASAGPSEAAGEQTEPGPRARRPARAWLRTAVVGAVCALAGVVGGASLDLRDGPSPAGTTALPAASAASTTTGLARLPANGTDPAAAGCTPDDVKLDEAPVLAGRTALGLVQLIYSPQCQGGWARFSQNPGQANPLVAVRVRAPDGRAASFTDIPLDTRSVYTDLLHAAGTCLTASATVTLPDGHTATATTSCVAGHPH